MHTNNDLDDITGVAIGWAIIMFFAGLAMTAIGFIVVGPLIMIMAASIFKSERQALPRKQ
jgi:hypothetical protein